MLPMAPRPVTADNGWPRPSNGAHGQSRPNTAGQVAINSRPNTGGMSTRLPACEWQSTQHRTIRIDPRFDTTWVGCPIKKSTVAETKLYATELLGSRVIWRGNLDKELVEHVQDRRSFANYKLDNARQASKNSRAYAQEWAVKQRERAVTLARINAAAARKAKEAEDAARARIAPESPSGAKPESAKGRIAPETPRVARVAETSLPAQNTPRAVGRQPTIESAGTNSRRTVADAVQTPSTPSATRGTVSAKRINAKAQAEALKAMKGDANTQATFVSKKKNMFKGLPSRVMDAQEAEFKQLSADEQKAYFDAFAAHATAGRVDSRTMSLAIDSLGLRWGAPLETWVRQTCQNSEVTGNTDFRGFAFFTVPKVRARIIQAQQHTILKAFAEGAGAEEGACLTKDQARHLIEHLIGQGFMCMDIVREVRRCFEVVLDEQEAREVARKREKALANIIGEPTEMEEEHLAQLLSQPKEWSIPFDELEVSYQSVSERFERTLRHYYNTICEECAPLISFEIIEEMDRDVTSFYLCFRRYDKEESGELDIGHVCHIMQEFGLLSGKPASDETVMRLVGGVDVDGNGALKFGEVLLLFHDARESMKIHRREMVSDIFTRFDADCSGALNMKELSAIFSELGLRPTSQAGQREIKRMLDGCDKDGTGQIDFEEFQDLVELVTEKLLRIKHYHQVELGLSLHYSEEQVQEFRDVFWHLDDDGSGSLDIGELRKAMQLLRQRIDGDNLRLLLDKFGVSEKGKLDFSEFLRLMSSFESAGEQAGECPTSDRNTVMQTVLNADTLYGAAEGACPF